MIKRFLVTGGGGFLGANVAAEVLRRGDSLAVLDNLSRRGSQENLEWLRGQGSFEFRRTDIRDAAGVAEAVRELRPDVVFHFAGQVAMTTSIDDPRLDFETNAAGSFNLLDAVRTSSPEATVLYSSTNKVYGDLSSLSYEEHPSRWVASGWEHGFDESLPLSFHGPYGCSKGAADQYMLDFARIYDIRTVVFRHSSIFGDRQFSTFDQGWIGWFVQEAITRQQGRANGAVVVSGDGKQVRDVLFSRDAVACYFRAVDEIARVRGEVFNIGGGMSNSLSLIELFDLLEAMLGIEMPMTHREWRAADQKVFVADIRKAERLLGWSPTVTAEEGIRRMIEWTNSHG